MNPRYHIPEFRTAVRTDRVCQNCDKRQNSRFDQTPAGALALARRPVFRILRFHRMRTMYALFPFLGYGTGVTTGIVDPGCGSGDALGFGVGCGVDKSSPSSAVRSTSCSSSNCPSITRFCKSELMRLVAPEHLRRKLLLEQIKIDRTGQFVDLVPLFGDDAEKELGDAVDVLLGEIGGFKVKFVHRM